MRGLDVGDPVAQRLADGVLERARSTVDRPDLGAERLHPQHIGRLALDVLNAHMDDARDLEQSAGRRRGYAVHAGAGLRNDSALAQPPGQENLTQSVVELVGAGVV